MNKPSSEEKILDALEAIEEFVKLMHQSFLSAKDYDYAKEVLLPRIGGDIAESPGH